MNKTLSEIIKEQHNIHDVLAIIDLDQWYNFPPQERLIWLFDEVKQHYRPEFLVNQKLLFQLTLGDEFLDESQEVGEILKSLQQVLNKIDISNFFVTVIMPIGHMSQKQQMILHNSSTDPEPLQFVFYSGGVAPIPKIIANSAVRNGYDYNSRAPVDINLKDLTPRHRQLLLHSDVFCMYPWIHMFVSPNGDTYPCCGYIYEDDHKIGTTSKHTLKEIWNSDALKKVRQNMLNEKTTPGCARCYEQEKAGFFSMRNSANKHHGKHVARIEQTRDDGYFDDFSMLYWDVRFNNLCNLRCRSCGPQFSSSWYRDQKQLAPDYNKPALIFAGKFESDLWEQLIQHIDHVEQIYFAGGEPLMMDEHYRILEELDRRGKFDVRLIYNTNFTISRLGKRSVFEYWKKFKHVAVGASLDASGTRAEYIRKGTVWEEVEHNRKQMLEICPQVDFYISATLSILNAWHLPDFHRDWVEKKLIAARDFNINNLIGPDHYRIDVFPAKYKQIIEQKYLDHLVWLAPFDDLNRASNGFRSAIKFMNAIDNSHLLPKFQAKTLQLDTIRQEKITESLPELADLIC
jgi:radical SAM protein with 4Fe4S-binding SPASM domain